MRIDYVANVRMPTEKAHGVQIMKMCEAWAREHDVTLWAPRRINFIKEDPFKFYKVEKKFEIKKVFSIDLLPFRFLGKIGFYIQNISFAKMASFRVVARKQKFIFSRDFWSSYLISFFKDNVIYEIHDSPNTHFITRHAFSKIKRFVVTNNYKKQELIEKFKIKEESIFVAQNGVDLDFFNPSLSKEECRKKVDLPLNKKIILYNGHLFSWKGADILLEAAKNIDRDDILTVFVGGTREDVVRFKDEIKNPNIFILGHRKYETMPYFLRSADVFALPNTAREKISLKETSPIKLFEYMASERPIVASEIPSIREIVGESEVTFFKADDAEDLKNKILSVLDDPDSYRDKVKNARSLVDNYSWDKRANKILNWITKV